jgi:hypothetical protein
MKNLCTHSSGHISPATVPVTLNSQNRKAFSRRPNNILVTLLSVSLLLLSQFSTAQAPQQFSFQGAARGADGKVVANHEIGYSFNLHQDNPGGPIVYTREGSATTNGSGIFNITVGTSASPIPATLEWGAKSFFLQVGVDSDGATNGYTFTDIGTTQLLSVPYSFYSNEAGKWRNNEPVLQTGNLGQGAALPTVGFGSRLIWHPKKAAFRAGYANINEWEDGAIGAYSFAGGNGPKATGITSVSIGNNSQALAENAIALGYNSIANAANSVAIGENTSATGTHAVSIGQGTNAGGDNSLAMGLNTTATGDNSLAMGAGTTATQTGSIAIGNNAYAPGIGAISIGQYTTASATYSTALGRFNHNGDVPTGNLTDKLFQIGNGTGLNQRSNALTILKNGNLGIGSNAVDPEFILDLGGRARIRHNGATAGLYLNSSLNEPVAFIGMKQNDQVGFYIGDFWVFYVNHTAAFVNGSQVQVSDKRLKKNITPFGLSIPKLSHLQGYNYNWLDSRKGQSVQTGLIAQEVEQQFPELVIADKDGYKAVNYIGLIPHLIEAVKELDKRTEEIAGLKKEFAEMKEINKRMTALEAGLKSLLTENKSAIGKSQAK